MMHCSEWLQFALLSSLFVTTFGGCSFPQDWSGRWFQYAEGYLTINATSFGRKGECDQKDGDKYIVYERRQSEPCRSCIAVYKRHDNVIQYKESNCLLSDSLEELCHDIKGDQPLLTMFRADDAVPISCPFKSPPYKFSYNRGTGDCSSPPSRIDSCTDDSKLLVTFAACTDVDGTESGVEELNCLATWKEGNSRYLIGKIKKKDLILSEEESYRCFMYSRKPGNEVVYQVAQSADATCSTVSSPSDGSKTMLLTRMEGNHERCKFPSWVASHHHYHWHSLDNAHSYHFTHKNATLRVTREHGPTEMRLVCHHVVTNSTATVMLVAHVTAGCKNGYICMIFHKRDNSVIQLQQSNEMVEDPAEACNTPLSESYYMSNPVTLISTAVTGPQPQIATCPQPGRYISSGPVDWVATSQLCHTNTSVQIGCLTSPNVISLQTCDPDSTIAYSCHGSWSENQTTYIIVSPVSRKSTDAKRYCLILTQSNRYATLHRLADSCNLSSNRVTLPLNLTLQGACKEGSVSKDSSAIVQPSMLTLFCVSVAILFIKFLR